MNSTGPMHPLSPKRSKVAIYDTPAIVGRALRDVLGKSGHEVIFEGKLGAETARNDADIWITKWSFLLKKDFLRHHHPAIGLVTLSVGTEHIDVEALRGMDVRVENCPTFSSNSVAEHAMALAFRGIYGNAGINAPKGRPVVFTNFSDYCAERAIAHMLLRERQMGKSIARAQRYDYGRLDEPWENGELSGTKVGIVGQDREAFLLARMLAFGFGCDLMGFGTSEELDGYGVKPTELIRLVEEARYIFLCSDRYGMLAPRFQADARFLAGAELGMAGAKVAVLGTGRIGSIIAKICRLGFGCEVVAYDTSERQNLLQLGVNYVPSVGEAIRDSNFIFIALPLNDGTRGILNGSQMALFSISCPRVLVNVTRDQILSSEELYEFITRGAFLSYGTDVLPNDVILWSGGEPDNLTKKFVQHANVVATPHEGDCSRQSLERLRREVLEKISDVLR